MTYGLENEHALRSFLENNKNASSIPNRTLNWSPPNIFLTGNSENEGFKENSAKPFAYSKLYLDLITQGIGDPPEAKIFEEAIKNCASLEELREIFTGQNIGTQLFGSQPSKEIVDLINRTMELGKPEANLPNEFNLKLTPDLYGLNDKFQDLCKPLRTKFDLIKILTDFNVQQKFNLAAEPVKTTRRFPGLLQAFQKTRTTFVDDETKDDRESLQKFLNKLKEDVKSGQRTPEIALKEMAEKVSSLRDKYSRSLSSNVTQFNRVLNDLEKNRQHLGKRVGIDLSHQDAKAKSSVKK